MDCPELKAYHDRLNVIRNQQNESVDNSTSKIEEISNHLVENSTSKVGEIPGKDQWNEKRHYPNYEFNNKTMSKNEYKLQSGVFRDEWKLTSKKDEIYRNKKADVKYQKSKVTPQYIEHLKNLKTNKNMKNTSNLNGMRQVGQIYTNVEIPGRRDALHN